MGIMNGGTGIRENGNGNKVLSREWVRIGMGMGGNGNSKSHSHTPLV